MLIEKYIKKIVLVFICCATACSLSFAQQTQQSIHTARYRDSIMVKNAAKDSMMARMGSTLKNKLHLTDEQSKLLQQLRQNQDKKIDSVRLAQGTIEQRAEYHKKLNDAYNEQLKTILNKDQWVQYRSMVSVQRDSLQARAKRMKITVKEVKDDN